MRVANGGVGDAETREAKRAIVRSGDADVRARVERVSDAGLVGVGRVVSDDGGRARLQMVGLKGTIDL